jgi:hypothetical protein
MPQRDKLHETVKRALQRGGWTITHDPYSISYEGDQLFIDLAAEQLLAAEQGEERIAVEVKGFTGPSAIADVQQAIGQYLLYRSILARTDPERTLLLAVSAETEMDVLVRPAVQVFFLDHAVRCLIVDTTHEEIVRWKP